MADLSTPSIVLAVAMGLFTAIAAIWDHRFMKIPNKLTLPVFALGWIYQGVFHGPYGLLNGLGGFVAGFGILFLLWMVGGGGGGDVKLIGALSVWLGYRMTLAVLLVSVLLVVVLTGLTLLYGVMRRGMRATKDQYLATGKGKPTLKESIEKKQGRRVMAFAFPVCVATWIVLAWMLPRVDKQVRAAEEKRLNAAANETGKAAGKPADQSDRPAGTEGPKTDAPVKSEAPATTTVPPADADVPVKPDAAPAR